MKFFWGGVVVVDFERKMVWNDDGGGGRNK